MKLIKEQSGQTRPGATRPVRPVHRFVRSVEGLWTRYSTVGIGWGLSLAWPRRDQPRNRDHLSPTGERWCSKLYTFHPSSHGARGHPGDLTHPADRLARVPRTSRGMTVVFGVGGEHNFSRKRASAVRDLREPHRLRPRSVGPGTPTGLRRFPAGRSELHALQSAPKLSSLIYGLLSQAIRQG